MQVRHRVPTVFSIYMLDVICCALGCVVLLWQVSYQQAEQQTEAAKEAQANFLSASKDLESSSASVRDLKATLSGDREKARQLALDLDQSRRARDEASLLADDRLKQHQKTQAKLKLAEDTLAELQETSRKLNALLAQSKLDLDKKGSELVLVEKRNVDLQNRVAGLEKDKSGNLDALDAATQKLRDQVAKLLVAQEANEKLEKLMASLRLETKEKESTSGSRLQTLEESLERSKKAFLDSDKRYQDALAAIERLNQQLLTYTKDLNLAKSNLSALESEKSKLATKALALEVAADQRFAGIELKGESVLFLVDMSGSMKMTDSNTMNPDKWPMVCETIARLMRSLQGLRRFQVILFSDRPRYLFGHDGQWLKYESDPTAKMTLDKLKTVDPEGETNLHKAFGEAFRFRAIGLDTVYVISDGLPNSGDGLPANADKLSESQRTDLLSRDLRAKLKNDWNRSIAGKNRVRINTIGYFFESPDVGAFLWALAREHDGSFVGMSKP